MKSILMNRFGRDTGIAARRRLGRLRHTVGCRFDSCRHVAVYRMVNQTFKINIKVEKDETK
jgi:hypothetical protein